MQHFVQIHAVDSLVSYMAGVAMETRKPVVIMMHSVAPAFWAEAFNKHIGYNWYILRACMGLLAGILAK